MPINRGDCGEGSGGDGPAGCPGVDPGEDVAGGAFVVVDGFVAVEGDDVRDDRGPRVAEDQHVGESLPCFVQGAGDRDPALRVLTWWC